jgi:hypothetical protein
MTQRRGINTRNGRITQSTFRTTRTPDMNAADVTGAAFFFDKELAGGTTWSAVNVTLPLDIGDVTSTAGGHDADRNS